MVLVNTENVICLISVRKQLVVTDITSRMNTSVSITQNKVSTFVSFFYDASFTIATPPSQREREMWAGKLRLWPPLSRQLVTILNFLSHKIWCHKLLWPEYQSCRCLWQRKKYQASISILCQQWERRRLQNQLRLRLGNAKN